MYQKKFEIRWSDIDANRHLGNSAYLNFMSHTRMSFLTENGFGQKELVDHQLGPVVFYEHLYYFREVFPGQPIEVSLQLKGLAEDGKYFEFLHGFYDHKGRHLASCDMMGGWIDLKSRKLTGLPDDLYQMLAHLEKTEDFKLLTDKDTRKFNRYPSDRT